MPSAGVDFPLVQLFDEMHDDGPTISVWNAARGADMWTRSMVAGRGVEGGISADTRYRALATEPG